MDTDESPSWWQNWWVRGVGASFVVEVLTRVIFETGWISVLARFLIDGLLVQIRTSILVLVLSLTLVGLVVWRFALWKLVPQEDDLDGEDYTRDVIGDLVWEWNWIWGDLGTLTSICPKCGTELTEERRVTAGPGYRRELSGLKCIPCDEHWSVKSDDIYDIVETEIERRVRTGEWVEAVRKFGSKDDPLPVPIGP